MQATINETNLRQQETWLPSKKATPFRGKEKFRELKELQALSLQGKIELTDNFINHLLSDHKRPLVAWSGGRDSTILLYLVLRQKPSIDVGWVNTGVEFPECIHFIRWLTDEWNINLHIAKPETTFWQTSEEYGWPILGKGSSGYWWSRADALEKKGRRKLARATRDARISAACCRILKEKPMDNLCQRLGVDCIVTGNLVAESRQRFLVWAQRGACYFSEKRQRCSAWPLAWWIHEDILEFHRKFRVPHSPIYDMGHSRNGCWPCLMDFRFPDNKLRILRQSHPKLWQFLIVNKGLGKRILALKLALEDDGDTEDTRLESIYGHCETSSSLAKGKYKTRNLKSLTKLDEYVKVIADLNPEFFNSI
jgi:3'-phosphoadenosine 5'-phosphosulfate sulfotransferase (PAPS reductase)/FAD synthetase